MIKSVLPTQILKAFLGTTKDVSELKLNLKSIKKRIHHENTFKDHRFRHQPK